MLLPLINILLPSRKIVDSSLSFSERICNIYCQCCVIISNEKDSSNLHMHRQKELPHASHLRQHGAVIYIFLFYKSLHDIIVGFLLLGVVQFLQRFLHAPHLQRIFQEIITYMRILWKKRSVKICPYHMLIQNSLSWSSPLFP